jgi:glycosyltransferase involved in cell wall biosynthesis
MILPQFSVAMSVYKNDKVEHFRNALNSIIHQTVPPSEIILVVDGPITTKLMNVITEYQSKINYLFPIHLEKNCGLGTALRVAVESCSFELIARMDSDDISVYNRFEKQLKCFGEYNDLDIIGGNINEFIDDERNIVGKRIVPTSNMEIKKYMKSRCPFNHMTVMFKKSKVLKAGNYKDWFWNEDYYLWIRMYESGCGFGNLDDNLVNVRVGKEMYKRRGGKKYFISEKAIQKYMLKKKIIGIPRYFYNVGIRFIIQVLMPNNVRGYLFRMFARKN